MTAIYMADARVLAQMIDRWIADGARVVGPRRSVWDDVLFEPLEAGAECEFAYELQITPPKEWLMPQVETLMTYQVGARPSVQETIEAPPQVLFGLRPCDMKGIDVLDEALNARSADPYFSARRANTTCVVLACNRIFDGHFCHLLGTGPALAGGFDWQITLLGLDAAIEVNGPRGRALLDTVKDLVRPAGEDEALALKRRHDAAAESGQMNVDVAAVRDRLKSRPAQAAILERLAGRCQDCGGCSFVCPTCWCFSLVDVCTGETCGQRERRWDSCAFCGFTQMAGGHNPGQDRSCRTYRRLSHKLAIDAGPTCGPPCVGCGRCIGACLGSIDLGQVMQEVAAEGSTT